MPLSAVIVDDEQLARDELAYLLKSAGEVNVVAQGKNGLEAVNLVKEHNPDLLFLDVQMPGLDGFGVIKKYRYPKSYSRQLSISMRSRHSRSMRSITC
jgi:two-component system response regulator LytT